VVYSSTLCDIQLRAARVFCVMFISHIHGEAASSEHRGRVGEDAGHAAREVGRRGLAGSGLVGVGCLTELDAPVDLGAEVGGPQRVVEVGAIGGGQHDFRRVPRPPGHVALAAERGDGGGSIGGQLVTRALHPGQVPHQPQLRRVAGLARELFRAG